MVSAINDHIVPWESAYKTTGLVSGPVRFVLGSGGHIAGIVNPPGPEGLVPGRRRPTTRCRRRRRPGARAPSGAAGSWWEDWASWSAEHSGAMQDPPAHGQRARTRCSATGPGTYVPHAEPARLGVAGSRPAQPTALTGGAGRCSGTVA